MDYSSRTSLIASLQGAAVGLYSGLISALPTLVLIMSATLTALQLYVFIRDKLRKDKS